MTFDLPWKPLYPSQWSGEVSLERAVWRGEERRFAVQWHEDRVYFGPLNGPRTVWASLDACAEGDALACFEEAVESQRYGVCFSRHWEVWRRNILMYLQFIYAPDGTGLLREWSSRDWLAFAPEETRAWVLFPDDVLPRGETSDNIRAAVHCVEHELLMRPVSDEEREWLTFRSGSNQAEFEQVVRCLWNGGLIGPAAPKGWTGVSLFTSAPHLRGTINFLSPEWKGPIGLMNCLHAHFTAQGFEWHDSGWGKRRFRKLRAREPQLRVWCNPYGVHWSVRFSNADQPTFHEQLEARLQLREWLRGKAPDSQIEEWLAPHT